MSETSQISEVGAMKACARCAESFPVADFLPRNGPTAGKMPRSYCRACLAASMRSWRAAYTAKHGHGYKPKHSANTIRNQKSWFMKKLYGITMEQYDSMYAAQRGCCAICLTHQSETGRALHVDHDHETGAIRGLLCNGCNTGIGNLREDIQVLTAAIEYLRAHAAPEGAR